MEAQITNVSELLPLAAICDETFTVGKQTMLAPETTNTEAFGIEYLDNLYRYALLLTRNRFEAEDLLQETYVRAIEAFGRLREGSNVKGWLLTIMRNLRFNDLRKLRTRPQIVDVDVDGDSRFSGGLKGDKRDAHEVLEREEDAVRVRAAIEKLPPEFQEVIVLREFEELSYQEIASVIGCPVGTVMSRLGRSRAKLRRLLTQNGTSPRPHGRATRHE